MKALATGCALVVLVLASCGTLDRSNVTGLAEAQTTYFEDLTGTLKADRVLFETGLSQQMMSDRDRRSDRFQWERDLAKAEVLIRAGDEVGGRKRLLLMKTAEMDLATMERAQELDRIDEDRLAAILKLYDEVIAAAAALQANNAAIVQYLDEGDKDFLLRSLDLASMTRVASSIRQAEEELRGVEQEVRDKRRQEEARLQDALDRARDVLVDGVTLEELKEVIQNPDGNGDNQDGGDSNG